MRRYNSRIAAEALVKNEKFKRGSCINRGLIPGCLGAVTVDNLGCFDFDHRDRGGKVAAIADLIRHNSSDRRAIWRELDKCDLRCKNCHAMRTIEEKHSARRPLPMRDDDDSYLFGLDELRSRTSLEQHWPYRDI